jgi:hypothetical protein
MDYQIDSSCSTVREIQKGVTSTPMPGYVVCISVSFADYCGVRRLDNATILSSGMLILVPLGHAG